MLPPHNTSLIFEVSVLGREQFDKRKRRRTGVEYPTRTVYCCRRAMAMCFIDLPLVRYPLFSLSVHIHKGVVMTTERD